MALTPQVAGWCLIRNPNNSETVTQFWLAGKRNKKMGTKLYVGNLSFETTEDDIRDLFSSCGTVTSCNLIIDKFTSKSRGFAFVEMASQAEATKAISEMNGKEVSGRALTVNEARPREERSGGGGGGYRGGNDRRGGGGGRRERY
ncbi:MAG TPA: RNA-binding protein [Kiritimatiellia bacterium]|nr:RNA-binding protein [Kiritimatiellia bacterium]